MVKERVADQNVIDTRVCPNSPSKAHHWKLPAPSGSTVIGRYMHCGEQSNEWPNSWEVLGRHSGVDRQAPSADRIKFQLRRDRRRQRKTLTDEDTMVRRKTISLEELGLAQGLLSKEEQRIYE